MPHRNRPRTAARRAAAVCAALVLGACDGEPAGPDSAPMFGHVAGAVVAPGVDGFGGLTARVRWGQLDVAAPLTEDGVFSVGIPDRVEGLGFLSIEPGRGAAVHPAWVILSPGELDVEQTIVLAPTTWTIATGDHAGETVPIDPALAADPSVQPSYWGFYFPFGQTGYEQRVLEDTQWLGELNTWPEAAYPIPVAFDRTGGGGRVSARDSVAFWAHVERMERALGWNAFRPVRLEAREVLESPRRLEGGILVQVDRGLAVHGVGLTSPPGRSVWRLAGEAASWSGGDVDYVSFSSGDVGYAHVVVDSPERLADGRLVVHELMHTLGVGHGCAWASVQTYCETLATDLPTAADVAHLQVLDRMRTLERAHDTRWGVLAAVFGRRVLGLGLPPVPAPEGLNRPGSTLARMR